MSCNHTRCRYCDDGLHIDCGARPTLKEQEEEIEALREQKARLILMLQFLSILYSPTGAGLRN